MSRTQWGLALITQAPDGRGVAQLGLATLTRGKGGAPPMSTTTLSGGVIWIDLQQQEALGGHTIILHVAKSDAELRQRLVNEPWLSFASTFPDLKTAEQIVNHVIQTYQPAFAAWLSAKKGRKNFDHDMGNRIGHSIARGASSASPRTKACVIVDWVKTMTGQSFVLTAYPIM